MPRVRGTVALVWGRKLPAALDILTRTDLAERVAGPTIALEELVEQGSPRSRSPARRADRSATVRTSVRGSAPLHREAVSDQISTMASRFAHRVR